MSVCVFALLVWFSSKIPRISNVHLYPGPKALGTNVEIWGRRPLVCRRRKAPICVSKKHEGRNLTFVPWKVGEALPTTIKCNDDGPQNEAIFHQYSSAHALRMHENFLFLI